MKFLGAIIVYLLMAFVLSWGILMTFKGDFWVLTAGLLAYILLLVGLGCNLPKETH